MTETCALDPNKDCLRYRCPGPESEILTVAHVTSDEDGVRTLADRAFKVLAVICPDDRDRMAFTPRNFEEGPTDGR